MRTPRYGFKVRKRYKKVKKLQKAVYKCPRCGRPKLKRVGYALWHCTACGVVMAGGAYKPFTVKQ